MNRRRRRKGRLTWKLYAPVQATCCTIKRSQQAGVINGKHAAIFVTGSAPGGDPAEIERPDCRAVCRVDVKQRRPRREGSILYRNKDFAIGDQRIRSRPSEIDGPAVFERRRQMLGCDRAFVSGVDLEIASLFGSLSRSRGRKQSTDQRKEESREVLHVFLRFRKRNVTRGYGLCPLKLARE